MHHSATYIRWLIVRDHNLLQEECFLTNKSERPTLAKHRLTDVRYPFKNFRTLFFYLHRIHPCYVSFQHTSWEETSQAFNKRPNARTFSRNPCKSSKSREMQEKNPKMIKSCGDHFAWSFNMEWWPIQNAWQIRCFIEKRGWTKICSINEVITWQTFPNGWHCKLSTPKTFQS